MDWRIKYYGIQALAAFFSALIILVAFLLRLDTGLWCGALPLCAIVYTGAFVLARRFKPNASGGGQLSPREWEELRGALEDVPVMSVFHIVDADQGRVERFRHIPLLRSHLWEVLAEEEVEPARVVRAAFLLHRFGEDLSEYQDVWPAVDDDVVVAYLTDLTLERRRLVQRNNLRALTDKLPELISKLGKGDPRTDNPNTAPAQEAAWRILLFGDLAYAPLRESLRHKDPRIREAAIAMLYLLPDWPDKEADLLGIMETDTHPSVQVAALNILATLGPKVIPHIRQFVRDPMLSARAVEIIRELSP